MRAARLAALSFLLLPSAVLAEEAEVTFAYVPAPNAESLTVDQPMGRLTLNGWDKPEVRIVARKHAKDGATLDQLRVNVEMVDGKIRIRTGVRTKDNNFHSLPVAQGDQTAGIDLSVDAPRRINLRATTWSGDIDASGFRAGAALSSRGGEVHASDIEGEVRTAALKGKQRLSAIHGNVEADGVTGDVELDAIEGEILEAKVVEGQITARRVRSALVRLFSSSGGVVLIGMLRPGARYEVTTRDGDVRMVLERAPFTVSARAPAGSVRSKLALDHAVGSPTTLQGDFLGGGAQLELTALRGNVLLEAAAP
jgi:DUF4097 and DUF4098 domain-containing protein YvlB